MRSETSRNATNRSVSGCVEAADTEKNAAFGVA